jgi:hypothetical protein
MNHSKLQLILDLPRALSRRFHVLTVFEPKNAEFLSLETPFSMLSLFHQLSR